MSCMTKEDCLVRLTIESRGKYGQCHIILRFGVEWPITSNISQWTLH